MHTPALKLAQPAAGQPSHVRIREGIKQLILGMEQLGKGLDRTTHLLERQSVLITSATAARG
ncbi:MAG: hypothetical protein AAGB29_13440 [Planctomycetota bacterium]